MRALTDEHVVERLVRSTGVVAVSEVLLENREVTSWHQSVRSTSVNNNVSGLKTEIDVIKSDIIEAEGPPEGVGKVVPLESGALSSILRDVISTNGNS